MTSANQVRLQARRAAAARKKSARGHAKGVTLKGRAPRRLRIKA